jgi:hypothetical protein
MSADRGQTRIDEPTGSPGGAVATTPRDPDSQDQRRDSEATSRTADRKRRRRIRRLVIAAPFVVLLVWASVSYTTWMLRPSSLSWSVDSVEWVRYQIPFGIGNWVADRVENVYYNLHAPQKGGPQRKSLPAVGVKHPGITKTAAWPPPVTPIFPSPLPGEGVWNPTGPPVNGGPPVLVTTYRPDTDYPQDVAYVAWFDHTRSQVAYYPGRYEPPNAAVRGPTMVPNSQRSRLLATFNGGFTYVDGNNGSTINGQVNEPLKDGNATLVGYKDGRVDIVNWSGGPNAGPDVAWTRQSLAPIVWNGQLNPTLNENPDSPQWGYTLGGVTRVWRTAVGIDARGNLMYVASQDETVVSLAKIMQHVGAVRAMEFDINPEWHSLFTYTHTHGSGLIPTMVGPNPNQSVDRYLVPDDRDFFAVYLPIPGPVSVPWG